MREDEMICKNLQRNMREDSMLEFTAAQREHLAVCDTCTDLLLTRLLQQRRDVEIPAEFAARVCSHLDYEPRMSRVHRRITPGRGFTTAVAVLMVFALAWSAFAYLDPNRWNLTGAFSLALEYIVTFEIAVIALWLGIRRSAD